MESPYPPQLSLSSAPVQPHSSSPSDPSPASVTSVTTSSEPRQSRKRTLTEDDDQRELAAPTEVVEERIEDETNGSDAAARRLGAAPRRGELSRRLAERAKAAEERGWMVRSCSDEGEAPPVNAQGPTDEDRPQVKRRRVHKDDDDDTMLVENDPERVLERKAAAHPRPSRLRIVPSYRDTLLHAARSPLLPSPRINSPSTPPSRRLARPASSSSQPPYSSPLVPPPTASTSSTPFAFPATPATPTVPSLSSSSSAPSRPRIRRRANSLPTPSSRAFAARPSFHPARPAPYPHPTAPTHGRKQKLYDSRHRAAREATLTPESFLSAAASSFPIAQPELLTIHAVRLATLTGQTVAPGSVALAALVPPVTKTTLKELDLQEIMRNPQLRHDVVFDPNLMFRPNYDGERGTRKRKAAEQYWLAINRELACGCRCTAVHDGAHLPCVCLPSDAPARASPPPSSLAARLPSRLLSLIAELRSILLTLLPVPSGETSPVLPTTPTFGSTYSPPSPYPSAPASPTTLSAARNEILDVLDPAFIAQQLGRGVLDVQALAAFLGRTLKTHCAPMRDELVDEMVRACGVDIAKGLRDCFEILELMKLDIANHQLRSLRPYLVQTALDFERRFFQEYATRRRGHSPIDRLRSWISTSATEVAAKHKPRVLAAEEKVDSAVVHGLLNLVFTAPSSSSSTTPLPAVASIPDTVQLDTYRLQAFATDATDLTVVYMLSMLFSQLAYPARPSPAELDSLRKELWCIMASSTGSSSSLVGSAANVAGIPQAPPGKGPNKLTSASWRAGMKDVLLQVAARATQLRARPATETASPFSALPPVPAASTLSLVTSYFETNVRPSSKLFQLLQSRLRDTLATVIDEELAQEKANGPLGFTGWWAPATESSSMATGGAHPIRASGSSAAVSPEKGMMADAAPKRGIKRSADESDGEASASDDEGEKRQRTGRASSVSTRSPSAAPASPAQPSAVDAALARNGLTALSSEVRLLGHRIARVAAFNLAVYRSFYHALLDLPRPDSPATSQTTPSSPAL
ncbi:hypothetical protein JCM10207_002479 [Rhodosporidiobolus poonsookiae]